MQVRILCLPLVAPASQNLVEWSSVMNEVDYEFDWSDDVSFWWDFFDPADEEVLQAARELEDELRMEDLIERYRIDA